MNWIKNKHQTRVVGQSVVRPDALEKAVGKARYVGDLTRPGMLHAITVRAPAACMSDIKIDLSPALQVPGVICVATASDIPGKNIVPMIISDQPFLADENARFHGEAIAVIAAETLPAAMTAAKSAKVSGTIKTPLIDPLKAMQNEAPLIYGSDNIFKSYNISRGDITAAFEEADIVVDQTYQTPHQAHSYLETQGMLAEPDDHGGIHVTGSMQCPFYVQDAVAAILGIQKNKVTVVQSATGGAFGGKEDVPSIVAGHASLLAWMTKKPVRLIYSREEDFLSMSKRHPSVTKVRIAAGHDGIFLGSDVHYILNGGAYATLSPIVLWRGTVHAAGPYRWKAVQIRSDAVATNTVPCGAFRGFGQPQVAFAIESAIDEMALKMNMDPVDLRRKNIIELGDITATGHRIDESCGLKDALEQGAESINWKKKWRSFSAATNDDEPKKATGTGCALSFYGVGLGAGGKHIDRAGAIVQVENDGSVRIYIGNTEMGQGARGVIAQIAAETLNAPYEKVFVARADTSRVPDSGPTVASRTTVMSGGAVKSACTEIRLNLCKTAADIFQCSIDDIKPENTLFFNKTNPDRSLKYEELVVHATAARKKLSANGWNLPPDTSFNKKGQGNAYMTYVWSANFAEIEIDLGTYEVNVLRLVAAHDVGRAVNPKEVKGQIQGGALQGLGYALMEELKWDNKGTILNPGFNGYVLPTFTDTPDIDPIIVEHPFSKGPYGAKGIGEPPLIAVAPAIANAVANALNIRIRSLPLSPEKILKKLKLSGGSN